MIDEGYIKFDCNWQDGPPPTGIQDLVKARNRLRSLGLIGVYESLGIGYGNISQRLVGTDLFIISASATGQILDAGEEHFCLVDSCDIATNAVHCLGPMKASSESMTHFALYNALPEVNFVVHVHNPKLWHYCLNNSPFTPAEVPYGTPEMAFAVQKLVNSAIMKGRSAFAMAGHEDGVVCFGKGLEEVLKTLEDMCTFVEEGEGNEGRGNSRNLGGPEV